MLGVIWVEITKPYLGMLMVINLLAPVYVP